MDVDETQSEPRGWRVGAPLLALLICLLSAGLRYEAAVEHPAFDRSAPESVLRSDPALLYQLVQEVVEAGGTPENWDVEPRLAWPEKTDVPATYTVGQEYLVLAARRLLGDGTPLHVLVVQVMALMAALAGMGVYLLALELTGSARWSLLATLFYATLPASYRTMGFVLVREDLALPIFALHLGLALRAVRTDRIWAWVAAGLSLGATMATWHAGGILALLEMGVLVLGALLLNKHPLASRRAVFGLGAFLLVCVLVPALRSKGAVFDLPALCALCLVLGSYAGATRRTGFIAGGLVLAGFMRYLVFPSEDMGHVTQVLAGKLLHLGVRPTDPELLSFEARMMWQGPFATLSSGALWNFFRVALPLIPLLVLSTLRTKQRAPGELFLVAVLCTGLLLAWMAQRMVVLPGLVLPVLLALGARRAVANSARPFGSLGVSALVFFQLVIFAGWISTADLPWYNAARAGATAELVAAVDQRVPDEEAIAADFMLNPVLLASCGNPMVLQPKWERRAARERVEAFWTTAFRAGPQALRKLLTERFQCRWLVVDRSMLGGMYASLYLAGLPRGAGLPPGSAVEALCADTLVAGSVPGFELIWSSTTSNGASGLYRLFRITPP
ncbi:MAG: hypothetical protein ACI8QC_000371 [Planctomycetota bacterium]